MTAAEIARSLGLGRTVVHRLLATLQQRGYVIRHGDTYSPGPVVVRIARRVQPSLRAAAADIMRDLANTTGETVVLHIRDGEDAVVLEQVVGTTHVVRVEHEVGSRHPLRDGASGRAILAFLDDRSVKRALRGDDDPEATRALLEEVRDVGYAQSHDELQQGVAGLAAPVRSDDGSIASLAILAPTPRADHMLAHASMLRATADALTASLAAVDVD